MHGNLPAAAGAAIIPTVQTVSQESNTGDEISAQTGSEFFASVCKAIFGKDAGLALSMATGVPERSCYRYAAGDRDVPVLVLRAVLHSEQGEPFHTALMEGCTATWWLELQRDRHNANEIKKLDLK